MNRQYNTDNRYSEYTQSLVEKILYDGEDDDLERRSAGLIDLLSFVLHIVKTDDDLEQLIYDATSTAYPNTAHYQQSRDAFTSKASKRIPAYVGTVE